MIIIEGADCVGKTTFAQLLSKQLGLMYLHLGPMPADWDECNYMSLASRHAVFDRFHLSEMVYSRVLDRKTCIVNHRLLHSALMCRFGIFVVTIIAEPELIQQRFVDTEQMYELSQTLQCNDSFKNHMHPFTDLYIRTSVTAPFPTTAHANEVTHLWKKRQEARDLWNARLT